MSSNTTSAEQLGAEKPSNPHQHLNWRERLRVAATRPRPLQDETATFILANVMDIFATFILLRIGGSETNPIARFFLDHWGFDGMIFFKMMVIAFFCIVTQFIADQNLSRARSLLRFGSTVVACVVIYSAVLIMIQLW